MLDVWPAIPIVITDHSDYMSGVDDIIAALEQRDRVCDITLDDIPGRKMDAFVTLSLQCWDHSLRWKVFFSGRLTTR
jgi:hypothetical protein